MLFCVFQLLNLNVTQNVGIIKNKIKLYYYQLFDFLLNLPPVAISDMRRRKRKHVLTQMKINKHVLLYLIVDKRS